MGNWALIGKDLTELSTVKGNTELSTVKGNTELSTVKGKDLITWRHPWNVEHLRRYYQ